MNIGTLPSTEISAVTQPAIAPSSDALAIHRSPDEVLEEATRAAKALHDVIESKRSRLVLNGKTYLQFEDWQTLGRFYGVTAVCRVTKYVQFGEDEFMTRGFEATAEALLVGTNQIISSAEAICLDDESNWNGKPLFQLKSMAQTRACAKALRNILAWVVVLAGYAPTPAEEMDTSESGVASPRRRTELKVPNCDAKPTITFLQQKELFDLGVAKGWTRVQVMAFLGKLGYEQPNEISQVDFDAIRGELSEA